MAIDKLMEEIKKLTTKQKEELFRKLGITNPEKKELRGGPNAPLAELIGMFDGSGTGSHKYKEDLYGGKRPNSLNTCHYWTCTNILLYNTF